MFQHAHHHESTLRTLLGELFRSGHTNMAHTLLYAIRMEFFIAGVVVGMMLKRIFSLCKKYVFRRD